MDIFDTTQQELTNSAEMVLSTFLEYLPAVVGALILLLGGILVASFVKGLVVRLIKWTHISTLFDSLGLRKSMNNVGIKTDPLDIIGGFVYWTTYLVFVIGAFEVLGMTIVVETLQDLVGYLPQVVLASITALLTLVIARWVRKAVEAATQTLAVNTGIVSSVAAGAVYVFGAVIVLSQLGLDMTIITANITVIVASLAIASAFLFAFGARTLSSNVLSGFFVGDYVKEGQQVTLLGKTGTVTSVTRTGVVITTANGQEFIPNSLIQQHGSLELEK